ncbi:MAG: prepilin-type N-terminal cleavage/methylation domain-containing protein [Gemmatimonadales bacterium]
MTNSIVKFRARARRGMTLIEVMIAIVILSGAMIGLAKFGGNFEHITATSADMSLASDLATLRIEQVKAYRVYSTLVATFNNTTQTYSTDPYKGFSVRTVAARCAGCPTASNDYITITATVSGRSLVSPIAKTTIIAVF